MVKVGNALYDWVKKTILDSKQILRCSRGSFLPENGC